MVSEFLPTDETDWEIAYQRLNLGNETIHGGRYTHSGSEMILEQFLLLRVLWEERQGAIDLGLFSKWPGESLRQRAKTYLHSETHWKIYLESIKGGWFGKRLRTLGEFSLVRQLQIPLSKTMDQSQFWIVPKVMFNTETNTTAGGSWQIRNDPTFVRPDLPSQPSTPTRNIGDPGPDYQMGDSSSDISNLSAAPSGLLTPHLPMRPQDAKEIAVVKDEEIVNMSLIVFLQSLIIYCEQVCGDWTPHPMPFLVKNSRGKKIYEARVDGYLENSYEGRPCAIVEVKPFIRYDNAVNDIKMQEAAQMAAWIFQDPPRNLEECRQQSCSMTRLLISQDRHEVYLTLAEFDAAYVDFIQRGTDPGRSFLKMRDFGPFDLFNSEEVDWLGEILLAFSMQECPTGRV